MPSVRRGLNWMMIMMNFRLFCREDDGATAIEYALIASLIAVALITILSALGSQLGVVFGEVSSALK